MTHVTILISPRSASRPLAHAQAANASAAPTRPHRSRLIDRIDPVPDLARAYVVKSSRFCCQVATVWLTKWPRWRVGDMWRDRWPGRYVRLDDVVMGAVMTWDRRSEDRQGESEGRERHSDVKPYRHEDVSIDRLAQIA